MRGAVLLGRLDLADESAELGFEYDGDEWHSSPQQLEHDRARRREFEDDGWLVRAFRAEAVFGRARSVRGGAQEGSRQEARARRGLRIVD